MAQALQAEELAKMMQWDFKAYDLDTVDGLAEAAFNNVQFDKELPQIIRLDDEGSRDWKGNKVADLKRWLA